MYILMGVHWGCFGGCAHSHECTLGVSRWMCTSLWVYVERYEVGVYVTIGGFNADVYVAMVVCWGFHSGCVCSTSIILCLLGHIVTHNLCPCTAVHNVEASLSPV